MRKWVTIIAIAVLSLTGLVTAQSASSGADRKVATRVAPIYPELAKKMHIRGIVKVEAIVRPNGTVKSTRVLGGNPVLVDAALDAVGKWKFEPPKARQLKWCNWPSKVSSANSYQNPKKLEKQACPRSQERPSSSVRPTVATGVIPDSDLSFPFE